MRHYNLKLIIFALISILGQNAGCQASSIDIISYDIKANLDLPNALLHVTARLEFQKADSLNEFEMLLTSDAKIRSIKSKVNHAWVDVPYEFTGKDTLRLAVPSELISTGKPIIDFEYTLPIGEFKSKDDAIILYRGNRWYPLIVDQIARFKLIAEVPPQYVVFSAGDLVEKKKLSDYSQFIWESKIPVFKLPLIIAKSELYAETVKNIDHKKIYLYSSTVDEKTKEEIISEAGRTLKFYNKLIGEYPHDRLTLIEIPELQGTNIGSALLIVGSDFIDAFKKGHYENLHLSIGTQWIAAGVFFKLFDKGFWFLQLSLPHYLRLMYLEQTKGEDAFFKGLQQGLDAYKEIAGTDKDVPIIDVDFPNTREKGTVIYGKGPYVIDKVHREIGDENWEKLIKDIYKGFKGRIFTYDEFIKYLSKYDQDGTCVLKLEKMVSQTGIPKD
ncbi:MAG: hypothetical protein ACE5KJ_00570 [Candidatus Zixiibacteriota bacterium]